MSWRTDFHNAPRGHTETRTLEVKGKTVSEEVFVPEWLWLASKCGKVVRSRWIPATKYGQGRWEFLATTEQPIAWREYIVPEFPHELESVNA